MQGNPRTLRLRQALAWGAAAVFAAGLFCAPLGVWTGPVLGVWFAGTQRPLKGFAWMLALTFLPALAFQWRWFLPLGAAKGPLPAPEALAYLLLSSVFAVLPFLFHRLASPRLPGIPATLAYPFASLAALAAAEACLPAPVFALIDPIQGTHAGAPYALVARFLGAGALVFLMAWSASLAVRAWTGGLRASGVRELAALFAGGCLFALGLGLTLPAQGSAAAQAYGLMPACLGLGGACALAAWAWTHPDRPASWGERPQALALLRSPQDRTPLRLVLENGKERLESPSGERFPIQEGIPDFRRPEDLSGLNRKYNGLYEAIGGLYDDSQRVWCALSGTDRDATVREYLSPLEVQAGDRVLETSVGTGLNFKYLPFGIHRYGIDLSPEMLKAARANFRRWGMDGELFLGNAECLPFADASFEVVFHVGGINFFNDRAKAILEMVRVAKPGSLLLIADETEEQVKEAYERAPVTGGYFKGREGTVSAPADLVPRDMLETRLETVQNGRFYVLTFRKPRSAKGAQNQ